MVAEGIFSCFANRSSISFHLARKKKFLLAFGLSTSARLLLMDEPTNGLDIPSKSQFRRVIAASLTEDQSVIISTHQVRDLESLIDPIIIIDEGRIIFQQDVAGITASLSFEVLPEIRENRQPIYYEEAWEVSRPSFPILIRKIPEWIWSYCLTGWYPIRKK